MAAKSDHADGNFLLFNHVARFRVSEIGEHISYNTYVKTWDDIYEEKQEQEWMREMGFKECDSYTNCNTIVATDNLFANHNGISLEFKPFLIADQMHLVPRLRLVDAPHDRHISAKWSLFVLIKEDGQEKVFKPISDGTKVFNKDDNELGFVYWNSRNGKHPFMADLPMEAAKLSDKGYLIDGGMTLALKYQLEIHRSVFENEKVPIYSRSMAQLSLCEPSDIDKLEYEELNTEVKSDSRFILESSDGARFCAHKNRLILASDYFKGMFREKPANQEFNETRDQELKMVDISTATLRQILAFIYLGNTVDSMELDVVELAKAADEYFLDKLKHHCHSHLLSFTNFYDITVGQIVDYLRLAYLTDMTELKKICMKWLHERWDTVKGDEDLKMLMDDDNGKKIMLDFADYLNTKTDTPVPVRHERRQLFPAAYSPFWNRPFSASDFLDYDSDQSI